MPVTQQLKPSLTIRDSSVRCVAPEMTLSIAKQWAIQLGISRVMDIGKLDCSGLPVFASVRPSAKVDIVTYGKGLKAIDAEVGAYMEAIEFAIADHDYPNKIITHWGTASDIAGAKKNPHRILDFCPLAHQSADLQAPLLLAQVEDVITGETVNIPAELVTFPAGDTGQLLFGCSSNGLASGNSVLEASVHALTEIIERDIWSFELIKSTADMIDEDSLPAKCRPIIAKIAAAGLQIALLSVTNQYGLAFFVAYLWEPDRLCARFFNAGWGCHHYKDIALTRAICEAAQSRAAIIHGGRDFTQSTDSSEALANYIQTHFLPRSERKNYAHIPDFEAGHDLFHQWRMLLDRVTKTLGQPIYRAIFTSAESPLQVVRIVVPGMENFKPNQMRVGKRLQAALEAL